MRKKQHLTEGKTARSAIERPTFLTDIGRPEETSNAMVRLVLAKLPFAVVPGEGSGPVLFSAEGTFSGLEGVERYIDRKRRAIP